MHVWKTSYSEREKCKEVINIGAGMHSLRRGVDQRGKYMKIEM
jgi:hypothetical protein